MDFAVHAPGDAEGKGHWVLAVDAMGERLLLADEERAFYWVLIRDCTFLKAATPDVPRPVVAVQPQAKPTLAMPRLQFNGGGHQ